ncbi:MAG: hypothetical protein K2O56_06795 [Muribaculaceae bacterium]|nr:hypothetical protein [Muribaculaceae bacterium]
MCRKSFFWQDLINEACYHFAVAMSFMAFLIGLYPAIGGRFDSDLAPSEIGAWFKADNFELTLLSKSSEVEWTMGNGVYVMTDEEGKRSLKAIR